jgi:hypothetical protein
MLAEFGSVVKTTGRFGGPDQGDRHVANLCREREDVVEFFLRRGIENLVAIERAQAVAIAVCLVVFGKDRHATTP